MELREHQLDVIDRLSSGKILYGGIGSGKSAAVLGYYMKYQAPKHIKVITTAKKRDSLDWEKEAAKFGIGLSEHTTVAGIIEVDSWNNIRNYEECEDMFFIFDEQRVVGYGSWVKSFLKIAKKNDWILLSGTPGDTWMDYVPVFIANGFYKNKTQFTREHVRYEPFLHFPKIKEYFGEQKLYVLRNDILVEMPYVKHTERMINWIDVDCDEKLLLKAYKDRWHVYEDRPIKDPAELFRVMRRIVNSDPSRLAWIRKLMRCHSRIIIFYNWNYELDILRTLNDDIPCFEWNGHRKDHNSTFEHGERWLYFVQYVAGAEAWNCTATDAMVLYSLTYSYKNHEQAQGRIDRMDTLFQTLYYYIFVSNSIPDIAVRRAISAKRTFNERKFMENLINSEPF